MSFVYGQQHLSRSARTGILMRRIEAAEAVVGLLVHEDPDADIETCATCRRLARWREARAVHEITEVPKPLARTKKRDAFAKAAVARLEAAEALLDEEAKRHWGRCEDGCRACPLLAEWRDAKFIHQAIDAYADRHG